jgi:hypothetical protein
MVNKGQLKTEGKAAKIQYILAQFGGNRLL